MARYWQYFQPLTATQDYSPGNALSLAIACDLAYQRSRKVEEIARTWGFPQVSFVSVSKGRTIDTQGYVMANEQHQVVVFRGSNSLQDWFANFQAVRDPGPLTRTLAHEGFQDALYPAVIELTNLIDRFRQPRQRLWLTGHSLGGALCSLYAGMLAENHYPLYGLYTFASPRPGDEAFAKRLGARIAGPHYRVVNSGDIVPHVPPEPFFSHPGKRMILQERDRVNSKASWFEQRVAALKVFVAETGRRLDVANNHRLSADGESYIPRLLKDWEAGQQI